MTWFGKGHRDPQRQHGFDLFGETLRRRRRWLGWTQRQLEAYSGIDQTVISRLENGKQYGLRWARLADLIDALGGLDVGPGAPDRSGYARDTVGSPRVDLTGGLDPKDDVDSQPGWSGWPDEPQDRAAMLDPPVAPDVTPASTPTSTSTSARTAAGTSARPGTSAPTLARTSAAPR
jgi:transcriptional regulator with XRE-family HTH domain